MAIEEKDQNKDAGFVKKVWITGSVFAFIIILFLLIKETFSVFLLILAGALIALFLRGFSALIQRKTTWKLGWCMALSVTTTLLLLAGVIWLAGAKISAQATELSDTLPKTIDQAKAQLNTSPLGKKLVDKLSSPQSVQKAKGVVSTFFKTTFGVFGDLYVVLFLGIFFTIAPKLYTNGIVHLVPKRGQAKATEVLQKIGSNLQKWLKGKIFAMFVVFVLTAIGLVIIGMPMWLVLALIAGLLNFIPNFGPLIAMIPAVLVGLMQGPVTAAIVAGLYILIQVVESNFITPTVQKKLINIPPALIIMAQLFIAPLTGGWGLVLATPLMVILIVLVQELYLKENNAGK
jgi:predicted PurR-regulated permease PerM